MPAFLISRVLVVPINTPSNPISASSVGIFSQEVSHNIQYGQDMRDSVDTIMASLYGIDNKSKGCLVFQKMENSWENLRDEFFQTQEDNMRYMNLIKTNKKSSSAAATSDEVDYKDYEKRLGIRDIFGDTPRPKVEGANT